MACSVAGSMWETSHTRAVVPLATPIASASVQGWPGTHHHCKDHHCIFPDALNTPVGAASDTPSGMTPMHPSTTAKRVGPWTTRLPRIMLTRKTHGQERGDGSNIWGTGAIGDEPECVVFCIPSPRSCTGRKRTRDRIQARCRAQTNK